MAEQFARHAVRAEITKGVSLPTYDDFSRRELPFYPLLFSWRELIVFSGEKKKISSKFHFQLSFFPP